MSPARRLPHGFPAPATTTDRDAVETPCQAEPDLWFSTDPDGIEYAKAICARCPVREACLAAAIELGEREGIWGGKTPAEREHGLLRCRQGCGRTFDNRRGRASHEVKGHAPKPTHCIKGHAMTGYNVLVSGGKRECRTCSVERRRAWRARARGEAS